MKEEDFQYMFIIVLVLVLSVTLYLHKQKSKYIDLLEDAYKEQVCLSDSLRVQNRKTTNLLNKVVKSLTDNGKNNPE